MKQKKQTKSTLVLPLGRSLPLMVDLLQSLVPMAARGIAIGDLSADTLYLADAESHVMISDLGMARGVIGRLRELPNPESHSTRAPKDTISVLASAAPAPGRLRVATDDETTMAYRTRRSLIGIDAPERTQQRMSPRRRPV